MPAHHGSGDQHNRCAEVLPTIACHDDIAVLTQQVVQYYHRRHAMPETCSRYMPACRLPRMPGMQPAPQTLCITLLPQARSYDFWLQRKDQGSCTSSGLSHSNGRRWLMISHCLGAQHMHSNTWEPYQNSCQQCACSCCAGPMQCCRISPGHCATIP